MATTDQQEDNNTLYFIVGGLVVLALVFAFIYMGNANADLSPDRIIERNNTTTSETRIIPEETETKTETNTTNYNFGEPPAPDNPNQQ